MALLGTNDAPAEPPQRYTLSPHLFLRVLLAPPPLSLALAVGSRVQACLPLQTPHGTAESFVTTGGMWKQVCNRKEERAMLIISPPSTLGHFLKKETKKERNDGNSVILNQWHIMLTLLGR